MKRNSRPLAHKLFANFACFVGIMLGLLWIMQTVFLNDFYKYTKTKEIKAVAANIQQHLLQENVGDYLVSLATKSNVCILVSDVGGRSLYEVGVGCPIESIQTHQLKSLIIQALVQDGSNLVELSSVSTVRVNGYPLFQENQTKIVDGILYTKILPTAQGNYAVVLNTAIVPVDATIATIRVQLLYLTAVMVVFAFFLALFLSKSLVAPIGKITNASKVLATGNYAIQFDAGEYLEVSELADSLNYAAKELGKVDALQREWIANISHDLRTPLTMIAGYSEVIRDIPGENTPENIQTVIDEARRLTSLVNDVLDISKLQSGALQLSLSRFDLHVLLQEIVERYQRLMARDGYQISLTYHNVPNSDKSFVIADESKITQVIYNLLNNAITYTGDDKQVLVTLSIEDGIAMIEIEDHGDGIASDQLEHIWSRYYKIADSHKRAHIGSGLGLSIVKDVLALHGAQFGVKSVMDEGSVFWFSLPMEKTN